MKKEYATLSDEALAVRVQLGEAAAAEELFRRYEGLLARARRYGRLADEAQSAALVGLWEAARGYDEARGVPFAGFAKAKVRAALRALVRGEQRTAAREEGGEAGRIYLESLPDPRGERREIEERAAFDDRLQGLAPRAKQLLWLLFGENLTQREAAARLGMSQQAASAMKRRALEKVRAGMRI
ncbi:MAG: sigma-70 family RNA polymerase sigma factor [Schwartzia sp.]|nr:sigma-70 family RNA polymerase sigma factor [Schwartzia sp. (in: firmicutes)]